MRTRRNISLADAATEALYELKSNKTYILSLETAVLRSLYAQGSLSKRQFDVCMEKLGHDV